MSNETIESLEKKIADILSRLDPKRITQEAVEKKLQSDEVVALQASGEGLRKQFNELSSTIISAEVAEAKTRRFDRLHDDALADGDVSKAEGLAIEKIQYLEDCKKLLADMQNLNSQIEQNEASLKALLVPVFRGSFDEIKLGLASKLSGAVSWAEKELAEFTRLQGDLGIKLFFNVESEMRIFREHEWREVRDKLDKWLP
jgi:hypothetical protein